MLIRVAAAAFVAVMAAALALWVRRRRRVARALGDPALVRRLGPADLARPPWARVALVGAAAVLVGAALASPRPDDNAAAGVQDGPVVLVIDVSTSMLVSDVGGARLQVARSLARDLVARLQGRPLGIVVFAGQAFVLTPPTLDPGALELYLESLDPGMATQTGSALAQALRQALALLATGEREGGSVVLISDGGALNDPAAALDAAALAGRAEIPVFTVGVGTMAGGPVPALNFRTGRADGYLRDETGGPVVSRLNEPLLQQVAQASGGKYLPAGDAALASLPELLQPARGADAAAPGAGGLQGWLIAGAVVLLAAEAAVGRWRRGGEA